MQIADKSLLPFLATSIIAFLFGMLTHSLFFSTNTPGGPSSVRELDAGYAYVRPLLVCDPNDENPGSTYSELQASLLATVRSALGKNQIQQASIYFRNLSTGKWTVIHPDDTYTPASLLKVPIMIAIYKQAELNPEILEKEVFASPLLLSEMKQQYIAPGRSVIPGETYTVEELIRLMIVYSDNRAKDLLGSIVESSEFAEVMYDLGIEQSVDGTYSVPPQAYSRFFRILYNATYLNRDMSERALQLLAESDYQDGLRGGVPAEVGVAHKFGEAVIMKDGALPDHELHDCGIVYKPDNEYILCVMTKGRDARLLESFIQEISGQVFNGAWTE